MLRVTLRHGSLKYKSVPKYNKLVGMDNAGVQQLIEETARTLIDELDDAPAVPGQLDEDAVACVDENGAPGPGQQMDEDAVAQADEDAVPAPVHQMDVHALVLVDAPGQVAPGEALEETQ